MFFLVVFLFKMYINDTLNSPIKINKEFAFYLSNMNYINTGLPSNLFFKI